MPTETTIGKTTLRLVTGDIADQDTDAVVTAAHWRLNKGMGTDGTIHTKGGPAIYEECRRIVGCPIGDAVVTTGGNLKARHVIHAVGPVWRGGDEPEPELLASAYRRSLQVAAEHGLRSISFPSISTDTTRRTCSIENDYRIPGARAAQPRRSADGAVSSRGRYGLHDVCNFAGADFGRE